MNYKESRQILEEIKKAKNILINCHRGPDPDAIGCALSMYKILAALGKGVKIICPSEVLDQNLSYLPDYGRIERAVDFGKFEFLNFDLFIILDSSSWEMVSKDMSISIPDMPIILIDHHHTNERFGKINLVDKKSTSVGEILYKLFIDWGVEIDTENDMIDKLSEGEEIELPQSVQIEPPQEYIIIVCPPNSIEWEELKEKLQLKMVRRGGYKKGSQFDDVGLERVLFYQDFKTRIKNAYSNTK